MTVEEMLVELLAIQLYANDCVAENVLPVWNVAGSEDREMYRQHARMAGPELIYTAMERYLTT